VPQDSLRPPGEALFSALSAVCTGHPYDEVLSAAMNVVLNAVRQNTGHRNGAIERMNELFGRGMNALMEHYDPTTGRRRSVVPFDQVISPQHTTFQSSFPPLGGGGKNGRS
jgi:hypothetical protein